MILYAICNLQTLKQNQCNQQIINFEIRFLLPKQIKSRKTIPKNHCQNQKNIIIYYKREANCKKSIFLFYIQLTKHTLVQLFFVFIKEKCR
jgi:hypothetical protein